MKTYKYILFTFLSAGFFLSCEQTEIPVPDACIESNALLSDGMLEPKTTFNVGETVLFKACAPATQYVIWTGDDTNNFDLNHGGKGANSGISMDSDTYGYTYPKEGTFKVVFFATNTEDAGEKKQTMTTFDIVIIK